MDIYNIIHEPYQIVSLKIIFIEFQVVHETSLAGPNQLISQASVT